MEMNYSYDMHLLELLWTSPGAGTGTGVDIEVDWAKFSDFRAGVELIWSTSTEW